MKTLCKIILPFFIALPIHAEESKSYVQWDTFRFTVNNMHAKKFTENMREHIKKFHTKGPMIAKIYNINYGPNTNELIWVMGPVSFSEMDGISDNKKHDDDWADNINPYVLSYNNGEIWREMDGLVINTMGQKDPQPEKFSLRYLTIAPDQDFDVVKYLLMQAKETVKKIGKAQYWAVMENRFLQGKDNGRHLMVITSMKSWAELDDDWEFSKHFEELYGKGSYKAFQANYNKAISNQWHEMTSLNKEMSGL